MEPSWRRKPTHGRLEDILESSSQELQGYLKFESRMHTLRGIFKALQDSDIKTIWLHGISGVGMTTLVKQVAACSAEFGLFDGVVSATVVARKPDEALEGVRRQLAKALGLSLVNYLGDIGERVFNRLKYRKFLVIVEDVWKLEGHVIRLMRMIGCSRCKILFTSRSWDCIYLESWFGRCAKETIGVLDEDEAQRLFYKTVGNDAEHKDLAAICNQVIQRCEGLPVLIVTIAAALSKWGKDPDWGNLLRQLEEMKNKEPREFAVEFICSNYLQKPQKLLFLLCGLLEIINGDQIEISDLKREWSQLEGVGGTSLDSLISDLKASSLLIKGETSRYVRMHDLVRDAVIQTANQAPGGIQHPLSRWLVRVIPESEMKHELKVLFRMNGLVSLVSLYPIVTVPKEMYEQVETWAPLFYQVNSISKELLYAAEKSESDLCGVNSVSRRHFMLREGESSKGGLRYRLEAIRERFFPLRAAEHSTSDVHYRLEAIRRKEGFASRDSESSNHTQQLKSVMGEMSAVFSKILPILEENLAYFPRPLHVIGDMDKAPLAKGKRMAALVALSNSGTQSHDKVPGGVIQFTIDSALSRMKTSVETESVRWIGISGEGRHQVIEAFKKGGEDNLLSLSVSEDWADRTRDTEEGDVLEQLSLQHKGLYLIDFHESVDVSEWIQLRTLWDLLKRMKIVFITKSPVSSLPVDLQINMEDHLLPWKLFFTNAGRVVHSSVPIREVAAELVKLCGGNLAATIIVARAMRDVSDVNVWKEALRSYEAPEFNRLGILKAAVNFVSRRRRWNVITKVCIVESLSDCQWVNRESFLTQWRSKGLINSSEEGQEILNDLIDAFFFESSRNLNVTRVLPELHDVISSIFELRPLVFHGTTGNMPIGDEWGYGELHLNQTELSELPENPSGSWLQKLLLQDNNVLTVIPSRFFESMKVLKVLNMSNTSIKTLPESFFKLTTLTELVLRGCRLFMELPPQIGKLVTLEVLDLEGTEIIRLPVEVQNLVNLTCLKVSFYGYGELPETMIPAGVLVKLSKLTELSIDVNPDDERWQKDVKTVMNEVFTLKQLRNVKLYLPEVKQLDEFKDHFPSLIFSKDSRFHFIIGSHFERIMSRTPLGVDTEFQKRSKCIRYIHGSKIPVKRLRYALGFSEGFFLDRHHSVTTLSQFGTDNMKQLEFCVLGECGELQIIIEEGPKSGWGDYGDEDNEVGDTGYEKDRYKETGKDGSSTFRSVAVLESLQYLVIYSMDNLRSIWVSEAPIHWRSFSQLKSMRLHSCPQLTTIFSVHLLGNLCMLEELIVEDCESIQNLVEPHPQSSNLPSKPFLPKLKKISLHYLPELVSISSGLHIAPKLEKMSFYDCPNLKTLSDTEVSSNHLKKIIAEEEWWNGLQWKEAEWKEGRPNNLARIFIPFKEDEDLMAQLAEDENAAQAS